MATLDIKQFQQGPKGPAKPIPHSKGLTFKDLGVSLSSTPKKSIVTRVGVSGHELAQLNEPLRSKLLAIADEIEPHTTKRYAFLEPEEPGGVRVICYNRDTYAPLSVRRMEGRSFALPWQQVKSDRREKWEKALKEALNGG